MPMAGNEEVRDKGLEITVHVRNGKPISTEVVDMETGERITKGCYAALTWKMEQNMNATLNIFIASQHVSIARNMTIKIEQEDGVE